MAKQHDKDDKPQPVVIVPPATPKPGDGATTQPPEVAPVGPSGAEGPPPNEFPRLPRPDFEPTRFPAEAPAGEHAASLEQMKAEGQFTQVPIPKKPEHAAAEAKAAEAKAKEPKFVSLAEGPKQLWTVSFPDNPQYVVAAVDRFDAVQTYMRGCGIISTPNQPSIGESLGAYTPPKKDEK